MSSTMRELRDEEEEENEEGEEGEGEGEESEDEDFVPNPASEDESDGDDNGAYDEDIPEIGGTVTAAAKKGKGKAGKATKAGSKRAPKAQKAKGAKRQRLGGGITLEEDEDDEEAAPAVVAADTAAPEPEVTTKSSVDDIWASMNSSTDRKGSRQPAAAAPTSAAASAPKESSKVDSLWAELQSSSSAGGSKAGGSGSKAVSTSGLDIKALLAKTGTSSSLSTAPPRTADMVQIKETVDFCGEEVTVTKNVKMGSKEELAYRQGAAAALSNSKGKEPSATSQPKTDAVSSAFAASAELRRQMLSQKTGAPAAAAAPSSAHPGLRFDSSLEFKAALPPPKLPGSAPKPTGLQGLLASIDGKKKLSTMEKSKHDWGQFKDKQDEHTCAPACHDAPAARFFSMLLTDVLLLPASHSLSVSQLTV